MDPNETLREVRRLVVAIRAANAPFGPRASLVSAEELADSIDDLDQWLTRGGFLPDGWAAR